MSILIENKEKHFCIINDDNEMGVIYGDVVRWFKTPEETVEAYNYAGSLGVIDLCVKDGKIYMVLQ